MAIIQSMNDSRYQILIQPMTVALLKKDLARYLCGPKMYFLLLCQRNQSLSHHTPLRFPLVLHFHLSIGLFHSPSESWNAFLISPCELKILLISYFLTSSMSHMLKGTNYAALIMQLYVRGGRRVILSDKTYLSKCMFSHSKRGQIAVTGAKISNLIKNVVLPAYNTITCKR